MLSGTAVIFFFGLGCLAASLSAFLDINFQGQLITFMVISAVSLGLLRRRLKSWLNRSDRQVRDNYVGSRVLTLNDINPGQTGRVELNGVEWKATSSDFIPSASMALIVAHDGLLLVVKPVSGNDEGE
jgi:membrane protein implicated in regulation of membrane protease activity